MTRTLMLAASAALFATGASAQMAPDWQPSAENCAKPQYATTQACQNFTEGRSASEPNKPADDTVGNSQSPGNSSGSDQGSAGAAGSGSGTGSGSGSGSGSGAN